MACELFFLSFIFDFMEDIKHRSYRFSVSIIEFLKNKKWDSLRLVIVKQLMRSITSVGANV